MRATMAMLLLVACYRGESSAPVTPEATVQQPERVRTAADPLGFLPIDSEIVIHLDVVQLRRSSVWARFEPMLMAKVQPALDRFSAVCGFDLAPMIRTIAVAGRQLDTPKSDAVVVVRGLERTPTLDCVQRTFASEPNLGSIRGELVTITNQHQPSFVLAFAGERTLVIRLGYGASEAELQAILDAGAPLRGSLAFTEVFGRIDSKRAAWFFMKGASSVTATMAALGVKPRAFFGWFDLASGLVAKAFVRMQSPSEATAFAQTLQGQLPAVQTFVDRLEVSAEDNDVIADLVLTEEQLSMITGFFGP